MTADDLFLATLDDLDARLTLGRGEYDALCMAWLLRRLFENGSRSLVSQVNVDPVIDLVFTVRDDIAIEHVAGWIPLAPTNDGAATVDLGLDGFLQRTAIVVWPGNDQSKRREISVKQLVLWLANNEGAVHLTESREGWKLALAEYRDTASYQTADGLYRGGVFDLTWVARVARDGLEPLRELVAGRIAARDDAAGRTPRWPDLHRRPSR
jgi:hypothetical protein